MLFHEWQTMFDEAGRINPHEKDWPLSRRYEQEADRLLAYPFKMPVVRSNRLIRLGSEYAWLKEGRPYYKVHPGMVKQLAHINLDNVPARFIEVPNDLISVSIRFTDPIATVIKQSGQSLLLAHQDRKDCPVGFRSVLFSKAKDLVTKGQDEYIVHLDEGVREVQQGFQCLVCNTVHFSIVGEDTIPQAMNRTIERLVEEDPIRGAAWLALKDRLEQLFRIIISIGFLANNPENGVIVPDILNRDEDAYKRAVKENDQPRIKTIVDRARRNHKHGWNVGTNEIFLEGTYPLRPHPKGEATGRELEWSHLRGGHFHPVRFGVGRERIMLKWFRTTRVRPDLPFKPE